MFSLLRSIFNDGTAGVRGKVISIYAFLLAMNVVAWIWAVVAFHDHPALLGTAVLAFSFGLRHAVDADHIAAIDNVTRKLMQENKRPIAVGFFFALGHSTIVIFVAAAVAGAATMLGAFQSLQEVGGAVSTIVSAL